MAEVQSQELARGQSLPLEASFLHLSILWGRRLSSICAPSGPWHVVSLEGDEVVG